MVAEQLTSATAQRPQGQRMKAREKKRKRNKNWRRKKREETLLVTHS